MSGWDWAWYVSGLCVLASAAYLGASILGARRRTRHEDQALALTKPPARERTPRPAPGPRLLMTSNFYSDGTTIVHDHQRRRSHRFGPGAGDFDDIDRALREELGL